MNVQPVLQFGEMSGSVQVKRTTPLRMDIGLTPGRRKVIDVRNYTLDINSKIFVLYISTILGSIYKSHSMCN